MNKSLMKFALLTIAITFLQDASAACVGAGCEGKDPAAEGCGSDAIVVARTKITDANIPGYTLATLDLKWSRKCQANWGLLTNNFGSGPQGSVFLKSVSVVNTSTGAVRTFTTSSSYPVISSPMTYGLGLCTYASGQLTVGRYPYYGTWFPYTSTVC